MYSITATPNEMSALGWLANRYTSAQILYDHTYLCEDVREDEIKQDTVVNWEISESEAWNYKAALEEEDPGGFIPCLDYDSHLGRSLLALEIV